jgi:hypothetical protein
MKINHKKTLAIGLSLAIFLPILVSAAGLVPCNGTADSPCNFSTFSTLLNNVLTWFIGISASVAAITFSIAGGKMLLNPENPAKKQEAMEMFKKTFWGMLIVLVAWLVITTVISKLTGSATGSGALRFFGK